MKMLLYTLLLVLAAQGSENERPRKWRRTARRLERVAVPNRTVRLLTCTGEETLEVSETATVSELWTAIEEALGYSPDSHIIQGAPRLTQDTAAPSEDDYLPLQGPDLRRSLISAYDHFAVFARNPIVVTEFNPDGLETPDAPSGEERQPLRAASKVSLGVGWLYWLNLRLGPWVDRDQELVTRLRIDFNPEEGAPLPTLLIGLAAEKSTWSSRDNPWPRTSMDPSRIFSGMLHRYSYHGHSGKFCDADAGYMRPPNTPNFPWAVEPGDILELRLRDSTLHYKLTHYYGRLHPDTGTWEQPLAAGGRVGLAVSLRTDGTVTILD